MRLLGHGRVWLECGEVLPVFCDCGHIYQPEAGSEHSLCPACRRLNDHSSTRGERVLLEDPRLPFTAVD